MLNYLALPVLWGVGLLLSSVIFDGLSGKDGYSLVFSWWLTAYFAKMININWFQLLTQFALVALILLAIFNMGGVWIYIS